jgi:hypothetical protein
VTNTIDDLTNWGINMRKGWIRESARHALAAKGVKTTPKFRETLKKRSIPTGRSGSSKTVFVTFPNTAWDDDYFDAALVEEKGGVRMHFVSNYSCTYHGNVFFPGKKIADMTEAEIRSTAFSVFLGLITHGEGNPQDAIRSHVKDLRAILTDDIMIDRDDMWKDSKMTAQSTIVPELQEYDKWYPKKVTSDELEYAKSLMPSSPAGKDTKDIDVELTLTRVFDSYPLTDKMDRKEKKHMTELFRAASQQGRDTKMRDVDLAIEMLEKFSREKEERMKNVEYQKKYPKLYEMDIKTIKNFKSFMKESKQFKAQLEDIDDSIPDGENDE